MGGGITPPPRVSRRGLGYIVFQMSSRDITSEWFDAITEMLPPFQVMLAIKFPQLSHLKSLSSVWVFGAFSGGSRVQTSYDSRHTCMGWLHEELNGDFPVRSVEQVFPRSQCTRR